MNDFLRFLLFLRPYARENEEGKKSARGGAITTRSLLPSLSWSLSPPVRYFPDFLRFLTPAGTAASVGTVCFCCQKIEGVNHMQRQSATSRMRRCSRCKRELRDTERGRHCPNCYEAVRPRCPECGESLIGPDESGVCYRCWLDPDYWIKEHLEFEP
jgi:hypothetical protein